MFLSEGFEAVRLVMTQILLVGLKFHPSELSAHLRWCHAFAQPLMRTPLPLLCLHMWLQLHINTAREGFSLI